MDPSAIKTPISAGWLCPLLLLTLATLPASEWRQLPIALEGSQCDALADEAGRLHVVAAAYTRIDREGRIELQEQAGLDGRQQALDFPPALALGTDGRVHVLTRHGGNWEQGHQLQYRRRELDGSWSAPLELGRPEARNYTVALAAPADGPVLALHGSLAGKDNVWGPLVAWAIDGERSRELGRIEGWWRSDNDCRLRSHAGAVFAVAGRNDPSGSVRIAAARGSGDPLAQWQQRVQVHQAGEGRRGMPALAIDGRGHSHLVYGARETLWYRQYDARFRAVGREDCLLFDQLGAWHLSLGLGEVAVSADGRLVLAVALRSDGSKLAEDCAVLWRLSRDGGQQWSEPQLIPDLRCHAGEGRRRPRLAWQGDRFALVVNDLRAPRQLGVWQLLP